MYLKTRLNQTSWKSVTLAVSASLLMSGVAWAEPTPTPSASASPCRTASTFSNPAAIIINDAGMAAPYPSDITVSGLTDPVTKVTVTITGFNHTFPSDVDMLVVGPGGQKFILVSDVIGGTDAVNINWTFDSAGVAFIGSTGAPVSGTFKPTNYTTCQDPFPEPAPAGPYLSPGGIGTPCGTDTLAAFNGVDPNGTWSLYVADDTAGDVGTITGGWSVNITTTGACATPTPSPSPIVPTPTPTPTPIPTPTPTPTPTATPTPTSPTPPPATPTPAPTLTPTPIPTATPISTPTPCFQGSFVIGDLNAVIGNHVTFWGAQWAHSNSLSNGRAPNSFKGFADSTSTNPPTCGGTWTSRPGNSSGPPSTIPRFITVIASSSVTQSGSTITGDSPLLVLVETDPGYQPNPGHAGTGTVRAVVCTSVPLTNVSTRLRVETADKVLIGGFIITGNDAKKVLLRANGPSLPVSDRLADPILELRDSSGQTIATNDNWMEAPNRQEIIDSTIPPVNGLESAILMNLAPGAYTATVRGTNNGTGVAVIEAYDLDQAVDSRLANISTRGFVETGDNVMIGGTIIKGTIPAKVLIRAIGPSLTNAGVANALQDPTLELRDGNGMLLASNDNWRSDQESEIMATALAPTNDLESAILRNLPPGAYTAVVRGKNDSTGVALVEAYQLP